MRTEKGVAEALLGMTGEFCPEIAGTKDDLHLVKEVQTLRNCTTNCEFVGNKLLSTLMQDAEMNGYTSAPIVFGSGLIWDYWLALAAQSVDNTGFDAEKFLDLYNYALVRTKYATSWATVADENPFIVMDRGAVQLVEFSCFQTNVMEAGNLKQYALVNPFDGLLVDVFENKTCTAGGIKTSIVMKRNVGLVGLPVGSQECEDNVLVHKYDVVNP